MPEHTPALFDRVPRGLFGPLGDLAELYWERLLYLAAYGLDGDSTFRLRPSRGRLQAEAYGYPDGMVEALPPDRLRHKK